MKTRLTKNFRLGSKVTATSLFNEKIIGIYRGRFSNYGALIFGRPIDTEDEEREHRCISLTLELAPLPKLFGQTGKIINRFKQGDPVAGINSLGHTITGFFMNRHDIKYSWIRGWIEGQSKLEPKEAHKVLNSTIVKLGLTNA